MTKGFKLINGVYFGRPRSGSTTECATLQSAMEKTRFHPGEMIIYGLLILLLTTGTYRRNGVWNSGLELWTDCVKKSPHKDRPYNNLGDVYFNQGRVQEATDHFQVALRINPNNAEAHNNLGNAYVMTGNRSLAMKEYEILKTMDPALANALYQKIK